MIGPSGVSGPSGDVTGIGGAAIVRRRFLRVEELASSPHEASLILLLYSLFARTSQAPQPMRGLTGRHNGLRSA